MTVKLVRSFLLLRMHIQCYIDDVYHIGRIVAFAMFSK